MRQSAVDKLSVAWDFRLRQTRDENSVGQSIWSTRRLLTYTCRICIYILCAYTLEYPMRGHLDFSLEHSAFFAELQTNGVHIKIHTETMIFMSFAQKQVQIYD